MAGRVSGNMQTIRAWGSKAGFTTRSKSRVGSSMAPFVIRLSADIGAAKRCPESPRGIGVPDPKHGQCCLTVQPQDVFIRIHAAGPALLGSRRGDDPRGAPDKKSFSSASCPIFKAKVALDAIRGEKRDPQPLFASSSAWLKAAAQRSSDGDLVWLGARSQRYAVNRWFEAEAVGAISDG